MNQQNENPLSLPDPGLIFVEGGTFTMGGNHGKYDDEKPEHPVKVSSFYIGKFQVTQQLWEAVMKNNPSNFKGQERPVETVSWDDAQDFIKKLNGIQKAQDFLKRLNPSGSTFRLPTEAEWEFAARGGIYSQGYTYAGSDKLKQVGWYNEYSDDETHEVGLLRPNELGLYDMSGNVWEWCEDWFDEKFYEKCKKQGLVENPINTARGDSRVLRGGGYFFNADYCRSAYRRRDAPGHRLDYSGFRLCLSLQSVG